MYTVESLRKAEDGCSPAREAASEEDVARGALNLMRGVVAPSRTSPVGEGPSNARVCKETQCWSTGRVRRDSSPIVSEVQPKSKVAAEQLLVARIGLASA